MPNPLTAQAGLRLGPVVLETLVKHYFERFKSTTGPAEGSTALRQEELLYDEAFNIVKSFLEEATYHTVEDVQSFSNTKTPSPPWVHVVRVLVPMSCCDDAAEHLIKLFGGEEQTKLTVGGVKWWQVRGLRGVDAQWITAKNDWQEAKKRYKMREKAKDAAGEFHEDDKYEAEMDEMRCILYCHGGGYYFGSVDQERYSIQRHARKINGRVFDLFLIQPPEGASHRPVKPSHIVIMGDSAGGGLSLALLQVIRDSGLPMPGGGVLISPWCDLSHSFPSIHMNTATDVIPPFGLSLQKPSTLWPPPPDELAKTVRSSLRHRIKQTISAAGWTNSDSTLQHGNSTAANVPIDQTNSGSTLQHEKPSSSTTANMPIDVGSTVHLPSPSTSNHQAITLVAANGETLFIDQQVQLYAQNSQITHPLISPALSYLGGLPPLLFIASDKEVLRDEIIYTAHRAAHPDRFPLKEEIRALYPPFSEIESQHQATAVHLQVYDDCAHVLPVLFSFTTPAKYCFRAIATFCKYITGMPISARARQSSSRTSTPGPFLPPRSQSAFSFKVAGSNNDKVSYANSDASDSTTEERKDLRTRKSLRRSLSASITRATSVLFTNHHIRGQLSSSHEDSASPIATPTEEPFQEPTDNGDVAGPRFNKKPSPKGTGVQMGITRTAGEGIVYSETTEFPSMKIAMIRERVSTRGVIRPLEPESELDAMKVPSSMIGALSELAIRRYLAGKSKFDKKFSSSIKTVEKHRKRNLNQAKKDATRTMSRLQEAFDRGSLPNDDLPRSKSVDSQELPFPADRWAWLLDSDERPPPSSIAARRDTQEARHLARIADEAVLQEHSFTGNNLWSMVVNFLTTSPGLSRTSKDADTPSSPPFSSPKPTSNFSSP